MDYGTVTGAFSVISPKIVAKGGILCVDINVPVSPS